MDPVVTLFEPGVFIVIAAFSKRPFKCYVTQWGVGVSALPGKSVTKV